MTAAKQLQRTHAIRFLAVCASTREWGIAVEAKELEVSNDAKALAIAAWEHARPHYPLKSFGSGNWLEQWGIYFDICAEAEALLRDGWAP